MTSRSTISVPRVVRDRAAELAHERGVTTAALVATLVHGAWQEQVVAQPTRPRPSAELLRDYRYVKGILKQRRERTDASTPKGYVQALENLAEWAERAFQERRAGALSRVAATNPWGVLFPNRSREWTWVLNENTGMLEEVSDARTA